MADKQAVRDWAMRQFVRDPVNESALADSRSDASVPAGGYAAQPDTTTGFGDRDRVLKQSREDIGHAIAFHSEAAGSRAYGPRKMSVSLSRVK